MLALDLDTINKKPKKRDVAPTDLTEKDILKENISDLSDLPSNPDESDSEGSVSPTPKAIIPTAKTQVEVTTIGLKKTVKRKSSPIKCGACDQTFPSQRQVNIHQKEEHPDFKYVCTTCQASFATYNSRYRHM